MDIDIVALIDRLQLRLDEINEPNPIVIANYHLEKEEVMKLVELSRN